MFEVGRVCIKLSGRDANRNCVILEEIDKNYVLVDGNVRRKKVNKSHIEPLNKVLNVKKGSKTEDILKLFEENNIKVKVKSKNFKKKEK